MHRIMPCCRIKTRLRRLYQTSRLFLGVCLFTLSYSVLALDFAPQVSYELTETSPTNIAVGDVNSDGYADLVITMSGEAGGVGTIAILLGDGAGGFPGFTQVNALDVDGLGFPPVGLAMADFNNDTHLDLAVTDYSTDSYSVYIFLGDGTGSFAPPAPSTTLTTGGRSPASAVAGFFNNDAHIDLAVGSDSGTGFGVSVFLGNGDGTFAATPDIADTMFIAITDIAIADFNQDGIDDLVTPQMALLNDGMAGVQQYRQSRQCQCQGRGGRGSQRRWLA